MRITPNIKKNNELKSFVFPVVVEKDEDKWSAYVPALADKGAATWGSTKKIALLHLQEVTKMVIESLLEDGVSLPENIMESKETVIAVTV
jgi:predicted RNase H-like HicB family nuclease